MSAGFGEQMARWYEAWLRHNLPGVAWVVRVGEDEGPREPDPAARPVAGNGGHLLVEPDDVNPVG
jgi:hypothetical protein